MNNNRVLFALFILHIAPSVRKFGMYMSIKIHYLYSHLDSFPNNLGDLREEQGERFHQDIKAMEDWYQGRWDTHMMADYCWALIRDNPKTKHAKKTGKKAPIPGTFFWKPRLGIDLSIPTTEPSATAKKPDIKNVRDGVVVLVQGYQGGMTVISLAAGLSSSKTYKTLDPLSAYFYTNAYRWALRYLSLVPHWIGSQSTHFVETHKVWKRRFFYMDEFVPNWLRNFFPYVKNKEWEQEELEFQRFKKYSEPAFGKHFRYPTKSFNNFTSQETKETEEYM